MKKYAVVSSLFVLGAALTGCSFSSNDTSGEGGEDQISLEVFQGKVEVSEQFQALADQYTEENPNVSIEITSVGGGSDYLGTLKSKFSSGDEPQIFSVAAPTETDEFGQYLADVSDTEAASQAIDGTLDAVTEGEEIKGLPFNLEGYGLIYNKNVFEEAGINAEEILSYEDLEEAVETLDSQKESLGIEEVFAFPGQELWVPGNHLSNTYLASDFNEDPLEAYSAETVEFGKGDEFQRMLDLQVEYSIQPTLNLNYSQQVEEYFAQQQVAIIQQGNWVYPSINQLDPEFAENGIGMMPLPVEGSEGELPVGVPNYWGVNNNSDEETIQAAKDFLDYMYTSEEGKDAVLNEFNFIPAYEGYDTEQIADPLSQDIYSYVEADNVINWVFLGYPGAWGDDLGSSVQKYLSDEITWEEVEEEATQAWEDARQE